MVAVTFTAANKMVAFPEKGKNLTDHATAISKIPFPRCRENDTLKA